MNKIIEIPNPFFGIRLIKVSYIETSREILNGYKEVAVIIKDISFQIFHIEIDLKDTPCFPIKIERESFQEWMAPTHPNITFPEKEMNEIRNHILKIAYP